MKVLLLNGSPRMKGNTRMALSLVQEGIKRELHPEEVEFYDVSRHKLSACLACDACKNNGGNCVQPDESADLVQKIYEADVVVFGTPVYWWGMSAQLKMAVDKLYSRTALFQAQEAKKVGLIVVGAAEIDDPEYRLIEEQMQCICNHLGWKLAFSYGISAWNPRDLEQKKETVEVLKEAWGTLE